MLFRHYLHVVNLKSGYKLFLRYNIKNSIGIFINPIQVVDMLTGIDSYDIVISYFNVETSKHT